MSRFHFSRRQTVSMIVAGMALAAAAVPAGASEQDISREMILNDPQTPQGGNPRGDVTIVAFLDYNCPYCKKSTPELEKLVREDGRIRLVYKDWPILTPASVHGARLALAAKYQGKYKEAHHALMGIPGRRIEADKMTAAVQAAPIDMVRLNADLQRHGEDIQALLDRNLAQASSIGLRGTPAYLIGPFRVESSLDYTAFKAAVADARARQAR